MTSYKFAPEVEQVALDLIADHRDDLEGIAIQFLFVEPPPKRHGREIWGRARRVGGLAAVLAGGSRHRDELVEPAPLYVIEISNRIWVKLDAARRRALVDHELMHLAPELDLESGELKYRIRGHDFEEFVDILRRHGLWTTAADGAAIAIAEQLALDLDDVLDGITGGDQS